MPAVPSVKQDPHIGTPVRRNSLHYNTQQAQYIHCFYHKQYVLCLIHNAVKTVMEVIIL